LPAHGKVLMAGGAVPGILVLPFGITMTYY
jgi:hypothetical protein